MRIVCDSCGTKYSIPDDRVRNKPFKIRCKKCSYTIVVDVAGGNEPATDAVWYVVINGEQVGPIAPRDVDEYFYSGQIDGESYIWRDGYPDWVQLTAAQEFQHLAAAAPAGGYSPEEEEPTRQVDRADVYGPAAAAADAAANAAAEAAAADAAAPDAAAEAAAADAAAGDSGGEEEDETRIMTMDAMGDSLAGDAAGQAAVSPSLSEPEPSSLSDEEGYQGFGGGLGGSLGEAPSEEPSLGNLDDLGSAEPAPPAASDGPRLSADDLVGARSENSVLFSLSNLQAIGGPRGEEKDLPTTEGSGLIDIKALAASQASAPSDSRQSFGGAEPDNFEGSVIPVPAMMPLGTRKSNTGLIIGISAGAIVLLGLIAIVAVLLMSDDKEPAAPSAKASEKETEDEQAIEAPDLGVGTQAGEVVAQNTAAEAAGTAANTAASSGAGAEGTEAAGTAGTVDAAGTNPDGTPAEGASTTGTAAETADGGTAAATTDPKSEEPEKKTDKKSSSSSRKKTTSSKKSTSGSSDSGSSTKTGSSSSTTKKTDSGSKKSTSGLSKKEVQDVIRKNFGKIRTCSRNADKKGKLQIAFTIKGDGRVTGAKIASSEFKGTKVGACCVKVVSSMRFRAAGGKPKNVKYPFAIN